LVSPLSVFFAQPALATSPLTSIKQISGGVTLDFEGVSYHNFANVVFQPYGISAGSAGLTMLVPWVTGNPDAPISDNCVFSPTTISTTVPWSSVGFSFLNTASITTPYTFTFTAYDHSHNVIYSATEKFAPSLTATDQEAAYNAAALFVGVTSTTPIQSISLSPSSNTGIDSFTFVDVPEPACLGLPAAGALLLTRKRKRGAGKPVARVVVP
jgi:hypothetical protein